MISSVCRTSIDWKRETHHDQSMSNLVKISLHEKKPRRRLSPATNLAFFHPSIDSRCRLSSRRTRKKATNFVLSFGQWWQDITTDIYKQIDTISLADRASAFSILDTVMWWMSFIKDVLIRPDSFTFSSFARYRSMVETLAHFLYFISETLTSSTMSTWGDK